MFKATSFRWWLFTKKGSKNKRVRVLNNEDFSKYI